MARLIRYEANRKQVKEILKWDTVAVDLHRRGLAVEEAARARGQIMERAYPGDRDVVPLDFRTSTEQGINRVRTTVAAVHPGAINAERKHRILGGAIDAAGL